MPVIVALPDGLKASFPDGTPPEAMKAAIQKRFPPTGPQVNMSVTDAFANKTKVPPPAPERPNLLNSTAATVNGLVSAVPGLQTASDALMGAGGMLLGKDYNETVQGLQ